MGRFSIILPVYNGGELVKECIQSILEQTYQDFDLLILDNNSNDGTLQWITTLQDSRISLFPSEKTVGIVESWSRIKDIPKNDFMTMIGHDDILQPCYLSDMNALIQKHPDASLYQTHFNYIDIKGTVLYPCMPMDEIQYGHEFLACQMARTMHSMGTGYMMRSKDFDQLGGMPQNYPNLIFADYQLWVQLSLITYKATSNKFSFNYRIHNNTSRLTNGEEYQKAFGQYVFFLADLMKTNPLIKHVIEKYGKDFLMYFCESLSHRLLKTSLRSRKTKVADFINQCKEYASLLIPGQEFHPEKRLRITAAKKLDASGVGRNAFQLFKKITSRS